MSIGYVASIAGTPLAQTHGPDVDRRAQETASAQRAARSEWKAEMAAGIGETDGEDHQTEDRDADGRRLWELPDGQSPPADAEDQSAATTPPPDPRGEVGQQLDLTG